MRIIKDYSRVDLSNPAGQAQFIGAVQAYMDRASVVSLNPPATLLDKPHLKKAITRIQEYTTASDMPLPYTQIDLAKVMSTFHQVDDLDVGFEKVFTIHDFSNVKKRTFEIIDISSGLAFEVVLPGEKAKLYKMTGSRAIVNIDRYGGGLQWDKTWFEDEEFWNIEAVTTEFRAEWFSSRAQAFYDLISASRSDTDVAWKGASGQTNADRDAQTINFACAEIIDALKNLGLDINPQTKFILVAPQQLMARTMNALRITLATGTAQNEVAYNIEPVFTTKLKNNALSAAETAQYFICLPGRKSQGAYRQPLTVLSQTDIIAYAETVAGWGRYGGAIGNTDQNRRCKTA